MTTHTQGRVKVHTTEVLGDSWVVPESFELGNKARLREVALVPNKEDARRVAACWNAFDGMTTNDVEMLARDGVSEAFKVYVRENMRLEAELSAARALLKGGAA